MPPIKIELPKVDARARRADTPFKLAAAGAVRSPSRPESRVEVRSSTPVILEKDEKDEFLRRENELQDQLADRESALAASEETLADLKEELAFLKKHDTKTGKDNEKLSGEVNELKLQLEKVSFESKEAQITMDGLKEANSELTSELDEVK